MKTIDQIIRNVPQHWVGDGFPVRSLFSYAEGEKFDPFLLLDYAGPHTFAPAEAPRGVGEHPHRGFETVTIVYQGELEHRDSAGHHGRIGADEVQWMTAASGVVHEEFHSERMTRDGGTLEMVQLWVNLPARAKMSPPRYQGITAAQIPTVALPDAAGSARVIAGSLLGTVGPAQTFTPINAWDVKLVSGANVTLPLPAGHTALFLVQTGRVQLGDTSLAAGELAVLKREGDHLAISAPDAARLLLLSGEPLGEPVVGQGPFVMNTRDEIRAAFRDYREGRLGELG